MCESNKTVPTNAAGGDDQGEEEAKNLPGTPIK